MRKVIVAALAATLALALAIPAFARAPQAEGAKPGDSTIVEIVVSNPGGNFDVLLAAVVAADPGVLSALADNEQYTVFAPTDQAFISTLGVASETEAIAAVTKWGLEELHLERIYAVPYAHNRASSRALEKCGFVLEGTLRRSAFKEGRFVDQ